MRCCARVVDEHPDLDATIHMAARIVVPESVEQPYEYYRDNVAKSLELFDAARRARQEPGAVLVRSAYASKPTDAGGLRGRPRRTPLDPPSPYARTKRMMEQVLEDMTAATELRAMILRYFNPIGSDPDLQSGIYVKEPSHVLGQLVLAARGQKDQFTITGTEHPTPGRHRDPRLHPRLGPRPGARARGGEASTRCSRAAGAPSVIINVGRGAGVTVRELVAAFEGVFGTPVPVNEAPPRPGDAVGRYANVDRARRLLGWRAELSLEDAIASALAWGEKRQEILGYE